MSDCLFKTGEGTNGTTQEDEIWHKYLKRDKNGFSKKFLEQKPQKKLPFCMIFVQNMPYIRKVISLDGER